MPINPNRTERWFPRKGLNTRIALDPARLASDELPTKLEELPEIIELFLVSGHPNIDAYAGYPEWQRSEATDLAHEYLKSVAATESSGEPETASVDMAEVYKRTHYAVQCTPSLQAVRQTVIVDADIKVG